MRCVVHGELWGQLIRAERERQQLTQRELAARVGVEQPTINRWERGKSEIRDHHKAALAAALGVPVGKLFPWVEGMVAAS